MYCFTQYLCKTQLETVVSWVFGVFVYLESCLRMYLPRQLARFWNRVCILKSYMFPLFLDFLTSHVKIARLPRMNMPDRL